MSIGKSKHWKDVIRILTKGKTDRISADPMIKYFQPLYIWLKVQNANENIVGWRTNHEDAALFQPLISATDSLNQFSIVNLVLTNILLLIMGK